MRKAVFFWGGFLVRPLWLVVYGVITILSSLDTVFAHWAWFREVSGGVMAIGLVRTVLQYFSGEWPYIFALVFAIAIIAGLYRRTGAYLGDEVKARLRIEEYAQNATSAPYLSLKVFNDEKADVTQCSARILQLKHYYTSKDIVPIEEVVNPNNLKLTWGGGSPTESVTIPRNGDHRVLNVAKSSSLGLIFLFHGHEHDYGRVGRFFAEIQINGLLGDKPIEPVVLHFCFECGFGIHEERREETEVGKPQRIVFVAGSPRPIFAFMDCPGEGE